MYDKELRFVKGVEEKNFFYPLTIDYPAALAA
jgi:hypothetical protein